MATLKHQYWKYGTGTDPLYKEHMGIDSIHAAAILKTKQALDGRTQLPLA